MVVRSSNALVVHSGPGNDDSTKLFAICGELQERLGVVMKLRGAPLVLRNFEALLHDGGNRTRDWKPSPGSAGGQCSRAAKKPILSELREQRHISGGEYVAMSDHIGITSP